MVSIKTKAPFHKRQSLRSNRQYKSGSTWAFWRWTYTPSDYITRLHLVKTPWFALCLHFINGPDPEPFEHDHPVTFLSIILRGLYVEMRNGKGRIVRNWNYLKASDKDTHKISWVAPGTITLCFMGPKRREWVFHSPEGLVPWKQYNKDKYRLESAI